MTAYPSPLRGTGQWLPLYASSRELHTALRKPYWETDPVPADGCCALSSNANAAHPPRQGSLTPGPQPRDSLFSYLLSWGALPRSFVPRYPAQLAYILSPLRGSLPVVVVLQDARLLTSQNIPLSSPIAQSRGVTPSQGFKC